MTARWARRAVRRDACRARLLHEQVSAAAAARDLRSAVELDPPVSVLSLRCGWNGATEDVSSYARAARLVVNAAGSLHQAR